MSYYKYQFEKELTLLDGDANLTESERLLVLRTLRDIKDELNSEIKSQEMTTELYGSLSQASLKKAKRGGGLLLCAGGVALAVAALKGFVPELEAIQDPAEFVANVSGCFSVIMGAYGGVLKYLHKGFQKDLDNLLKEKQEIFELEKQKCQKQIQTLSEFEK